MCVTNVKPSAIGYCAPEKLTDGTDNLYTIAVDKPLQGTGIGQKMMHFIERHLTSQGKRILIVETSSDEQYRQTREFYKKLGYIQEAIIHGVWKDGEHKVILLKKLG